jgi:hypothetical protein
MDLLFQHHLLKIFPFPLSRYLLKKIVCGGHWWLMPIILATQEAEIRKTMV